MVNKVAYVTPSLRKWATNPRLWPWLAWFMLHAGTALAARIDVTLDHNPVSIDESFTLTFSAQETPDDDPDFHALDQDFEVLAQNQSNQFSLDNGRASRRIEWQVTVMAKRTGALEIPPIPFGKDRSEPFSVTVTQGSARRGNSGNGEVFLEVEAEPKSPYVQAQVIYTVRVLSRVSFGEARLSTPEAGDALIERLGDGQNPSSIVIRDGVQYKMTEIRYALFPQKSGPLKIEPMRLEMQVASGGRSMFNSFFNQQTRTQRVNSEPLDLDVRPVPAEFKGKHWLPAEQLELEDSWAKNPPRTASGEPITRTLTVKAKGATVGLLPELNPQAAPASNDIKQYPDQPVLNEDKSSSGLSSSRQEKSALIASRPGNYRMPAVEIPWWNTTTNQPEIARLPERALAVLPSAETQAKETPPAQAEPVPPPETAPAPPATANLRLDGGSASNHWFWVALLFGLGWLATGLAWWLSRHPNVHRTERTTRERLNSVRRLIAAIERACRANDPLAARKALAEWDAHCWTGTALYGDDLEQRCGGTLGREIGLLNRGLYGREPTEWRGQALWQSFREQITRNESAEGERIADLEPLYKL